MGTTELQIKQLWSFFHRDLLAHPLLRIFMFSELNDMEFLTCVLPSNAEYADTFQPCLLVTVGTC